MPIRCQVMTRRAGARLPMNVVSSNQCKIICREFKWLYNLEIDYFYF